VPNYLPPATYSIYYKILLSITSINFLNNPAHVLKIIFEHEGKELWLREFDVGLVKLVKISLYGTSRGSM